MRLSFQLKECWVPVLKTLDTDLELNEVDPAICVSSKQWENWAVYSETFLLGR